MFKVKITPVLFLFAMAVSPLLDAAPLRLMNEGVTLEVNTGKGKLEVLAKRNGSELVSAHNILFNYMAADTWQLVKADANSIVLRGEFPASVEFMRKVTDNEKRNVSLVISKVSGGFRIRSEPEWAEQTTIELADLGGHIFGVTEALFPDNRLSPDLRDSVIPVEINADATKIYENYASAVSAFFMNSKGYGSFFDTFASGEYSFAINGEHRLHHDGGELDWYLFFGNDGRDIHQAYFSLIGEPKFVPAWGIGPVGWRDQNNGGAEEILDDVKKMTDLKIPFTSWFVDRPYSDGAHAWSKMNFSEKFKKPESWIATLSDTYGLELMTWTATAFFGDYRFNNHLEGEFNYLDLSDKESLAAFKSDLASKQHSVGVKGHKIDRADEKLPKYENWADESVKPPYRRNLYSYLMLKAHDESLRKAWGKDQVTFARSAIHRSQAYLSAIWAGDPRTSWEGMQANFANAARSGFMGFPVWGSDVGGYQGEGYIPEDLYIRWLQAGSVSGLFEIKLDGAGGDGRDRLPWSYGENLQNIFRQVCEDRMRLLPYLYSLANTSATTGVLMQPMAYRHLDDTNTYDIWDQFYIGEGLLAAPVFTRKESREVYLPEGEWYDFDHIATAFKGGKTVNVEAPLNKLPRFIRANSLYVSGENIYLGNDKNWKSGKKILTVHAFPGKKGQSSGFTYVDMLDADNKKHISLKTEKKSIQLTSPAMAHAVRVNVRLAHAPKKVTLNGSEINVVYSSEKKVLVVDVSPNEAIDLIIK